MAIPIRDSVLTAVPAEPRSERAKRAASDIPPLVEDRPPANDIEAVLPVVAEVALADVVRDLAGDV